MPKTFTPLMRCPKESIDSYCASAGLTYEEYVQSVREQAPKTITKAKLEEAVAREYCDANGIEFDSMNPSQEVRDAVAAYKADLLERNRNQIHYYDQQISTSSRKVKKF